MAALADAQLSFGAEGMPPAVAPIDASHSLWGSCVMHVSSQLWYTCFIWIIKVPLRPAPIIQHLLCSAILQWQLARGKQPGLPPVDLNHQSYTSLIHIFYSNIYITNINSIHSYLQLLKSILYPPISSCKWNSRTIPAEFQGYSMDLKFNPYIIFFSLQISAIV